MEVLAMIRWSSHFVVAAGMTLLLALALAGGGASAPAAETCNPDAAWKFPELYDPQVSSFCLVACSAVNAAAQSQAAGYYDDATKLERQAAVFCDLLRSTHARFHSAQNYSIRSACPVCNGR